LNYPPKAWTHIFVVDCDLPRLLLPIVLITKLSRLTGMELHYDVIGKFDTCEACSIGKARLKDVNKDWKGGSLTAHERLYVDICTIQGVSFGGAKFWALVHNC
jgi:hypothetical protein